MPRRLNLLVLLLCLLAATACGSSASRLGAPHPADEAAAPAVYPPGGPYPVAMRPQTPVNGPKGFSALQVPAVMRQTVVPHRASYLPEDLIKTGSAYEPVPAGAHVAASGTGAVFSPQWTSSASPIGDAAYALYEFNLDGYDQGATLRFIWGAGGTGDYSDFWVGLVNRDSERWDWFAGPRDNVLSIAAYTPYMDDAGQVWVALVFTGEDPWTLDSLNVGDPEVRAPGDEGLPTVADPLAPPVDPGLSLPDSVDLSPDCSPVNDQMIWSAAAGFAVGDGAYNYELGQIYGDLGWDFHDPFNLVSPKHLYVVSGELQGFPANPDYGRYTGQVAADLVDHGVATEKHAPYDLIYNNNWSAEALADAALLEIEDWQAIPCNDDAGIFTVRAILALQARPVILRTHIDSDFLNYESGVWNISGSPIAGHALLVVGYDQALSAFKVRNSWSEFWGEAGYLWIGYDTLKNPDAAARCWTIRDEYDPQVAARFVGAVPPLPPPVSVEAGDGTSGSGIRVDWTLVAGASGYRIFRDAPDNQIGSASAIPFYIDTSITDYDAHTYWVQAWAGTLDSALSSPDLGWRGHAPDITGVAPLEAYVGAATSFSATIASGDLPFTYAWDFAGGATPNTSSEESPTVTAGAPGNYLASLVVTNGAGSDTFNFTFKVRPYVTDLLVVYNSDILESIDLAQYYASPVTGRAIDQQYLLGLPLGATAGLDPDETVDRATYNSSIRDPIIAFLEGNPAIKAKVKYILLIKGIPLKINNDNQASVDSELCLLYEDIASGSYPKTSWIVNDYPGFAKWFGAASSGFYLADNESFQPNTFKVSYDPTWDVAPSGDEQMFTLNYLVARITAYTWDEAKSIIDRSLAADKSGQGWIILDSKNAQYGNQLDTMVDPVYPFASNDLDSGAELLLEAGMNVLADVTDTKVYFDHPALQPDHWQNVIGYASWGVHNGNPTDYILNSLGFEYLPGACFMSYESFNGYDTDAPTDAQIQRQGQGQICDFLRMGGTVAIGNVYEPFSIGVGDERWVFDRYLHHGDRWIEAAYKGLRFFSWMEVVVGDPLCTVVPE